MDEWEERSQDESGFGVIDGEMANNSKYSLFFQRL